MKRQVLQQRLYRIVRLMHCVLLANLISIFESSLAEQPQEIRLFHEPTDNNRDDVMNDAQLTDLNQSQAKPVEFQPLANTAKPSDTGGHSVYRYDGFISTASGSQYLINGLPLSDIDSLILVSVKHGGKSLVLKTAHSRPFELSVGQTIDKDSL